MATVNVVTVDGRSLPYEAHYGADGALLGVFPRAEEPAGLDERVRAALLESPGGSRITFARLDVDADCAAYSLYRPVADPRDVVLGAMLLVSVRDGSARLFSGYWLDHVFMWGSWSRVHSGRGFTGVICDWLAGLPAMPDAIRDGMRPLSVPADWPRLRTLPYMGKRVAEAAFNGFNAANGSSLADALASIYVAVDVHAKTWPRRLELRGRIWSALSKSWLEKGVQNEDSRPSSFRG